MKWLGATASFEDRIEGMHEDFGLFTDRGSYWAAIARRRIELPTFALRMQKHSLMSQRFWRTSDLFATILPHQRTTISTDGNFSQAWPLSVGSTDTPARLSGAEQNLRDQS